MSDRREKRQTVENVWALSIFELRRRRILKQWPGLSVFFLRHRSGQTALAVIRKPHAQELEFGSPLEIEINDVTYPVRLTSTPCFFGGKRYWFLCPSGHVSPISRVGILYWDPTTLHFLCRHCQGLTYELRQHHRDAGYESQRLYERSLTRLQRLRSPQKRAYWYRRLEEATAGIEAAVSKTIAGWEAVLRRHPQEA